MKFLTTLCLLSLPFLSNAQSSFVDAQMSITKGRVNNLRDEMTNKVYGTTLKASDYFAQLPQQERELDETLSTFEDEVQHVVFSPMAKLVDVYNSTYEAISNNQQFSQIQKEGLIKSLNQSQIGMIENQAVLSSVAYKQAIEKVYRLVPYALSSLVLNQLNARKVMFKENIFYRAELTYAGVAIRGSCETDASFESVKDFMKFPQQLGRFCIENFNGFMKTVFDKKIYPKVKGQCQSIACVSLRSSYYKSLLNSLQKDIDVDIVFNLASGHKVLINSLRKTSFDLLEMKYLDMVDYPEQLPFDI